MSRMCTVAIIGGGISGLICIKCCLDGGLSPTCYEMTNDIGGLWNYDVNAIDGKASVMRSTVINTSKEFMAFSDFPPPIDYPNYMHNTKLLAYFRMYAAQFKLLEYVRFRRRVTRVEPADDYEQTGCWLIYSVDAETKDEGNEKCERFNAVMLATGHHAYPRWATFAGLEQYKGKYLHEDHPLTLDYLGRKLHSWEYKTPHNFENQNVLIVGIGNSAIDMAVELGRTAAQVYLSTRRGAWILNRVGPNGRPIDLQFSNPVASAIQKYAPTLLNWMAERDLNKKFNHEVYSLKPKHRPLQQHPSVNDDLPNRILCGSVIIKPNIKEFTSDGYGVIFEDGTRVDHIDCIIMATGFQIAFPYLKENIVSVKDNKVRLYKFVWPSHFTHPTLAVMGLIQPIGAINPIVELQARWAVRLFKNERQLPSSLEMDQDIDACLDRMSKRYVASPRHTIQVDHLDYCNELADEVGCRPNIWNYLFNDFKLGCLLLFGPGTPYRYRLEGPNSWIDARQTILNQEERIEYPLRGHRELSKKTSLIWTPMFSFALIFLIFLIVFRYCF